MNENNESQFGKPPRNPQLVTFGVLVLAVGALGFVFFQVIQPFILPMFLAAVVAMLAMPMQEWLTIKLRYRAAAGGVLTLLTTLVVLVPIALLVFFAVKELNEARKIVEHLAAQNNGGLDPKTSPQLHSLVDTIGQYVPVDPEQIRQWLLNAAKNAGQFVYQRTIQVLGNVAGFVVALFMFLVSLYFFAVDGPKILAGWEQLTPFDSEHDRLIRKEFSSVCRGVVWATLLAALTQGIVLGLGLLIVELIFKTGVGSWIFLLSFITVVFAMVPFIGAFSVWGPVSGYMIYNGDYAAGIIFALYGACVVSTIDNVVKVVVIKDHASLHPLLVFVSVIGGIQLFGVLGVFIGPVVGAVLFAMMRVLKRELLRMGGHSQPGIILRDGASGTSTAS